MVALNVDDFFETAWSVLHSLLVYKRIWSKVQFGYKHFWNGEK